MASDKATQSDECWWATNISHIWAVICIFETAEMWSRWVPWYFIALHCPSVQTGPKSQEAPGLKGVKALQSWAEGGGIRRSDNTHKLKEMKRAARWIYMWSLPCAFGFKWWLISAVVFICLHKPCKTKKWLLHFYKYSELRFKFSVGCFPMKQLKRSRESQKHLQTL